LLALRVGVLPGRAAHGAVYNGFVGGMLPAAVLVVLVLHGLSAQTVAAVLLTVVAMVVRLMSLRARARGAEAERVERA
jgi:hypothetical protein